MKALEQNIKNLYGTKGKKWLSVQPIILKLRPDIDGLNREAIGLNAFKKCGAVKLLKNKNGILLLERAVPGISLRSYFPEKNNDAIRILCKCLKHLHKAKLPKTGNFPHIKDWLSTIDKNWNIPKKYLLKARQLRDHLLNTSAKDVLLHGDLHHDNILQNGDDWLVIDPKGVIGEPAYEVAAFIRNPIPDLLELDTAPSTISNRITCITKILKMPPQRILDWCFVQAVLAWIWALEDGGDTGYFKKLTEFFDKYRHKDI